MAIRIKILTLAIALLAGCAPIDSFRQKRDVQLSNRSFALASDFRQLDSQVRHSTFDHAYSPGQSMLEPRVKNGVAEIQLLEAIELALSNSKLVRITDGDEVAASNSTFYDIESAEARESAALAAFDATFESSIYARDVKRPPNSFFGPGLIQPLSRDEASYNFGIRKPLVNGGEALLSYNPDPLYFFVANPTGGGFNPIVSSNVQFSFNQPLLRGAGSKINLVPVQISQIGIEQSTWEFKKTVMESVASVITEYWNLYSSRAAISALDEVLPLYEEIVRLQEEALLAGWAVKADKAKATAQLHDTRQEKLRLEAKAVDQELKLRNLIGLSPELGWKLNPVTKPAKMYMSQSADDLLQQALCHQPDIVQQRLNVRIRQLELTVAENQMKPTLDISALYRLNGIGENLGDALDQMADADFRDYEVGANFSIPLGRRAARSGIFAADRKLIEDSELLQQEIFSVYHNLASSLKQLEYAYRQFEESEKRLAAAEEWVNGAQLRYQNPNPDDGGNNWLLENLNDYLDSIRFKTKAASEKAALLAEYNAEMAKLEQIKGTILEFYGVHYGNDPCCQVHHFQSQNQIHIQPDALPEVSPRVESVKENEQSTYDLMPYPLDQNFPAESMVKSTSEVSFPTPPINSDQSKLIPSNADATDSMPYPLWEND